MRRALALTGAAGLLAVGLASSPASADPTRNGTITLTCGPNVYAVTTGGNGQWTPAHDSASTTVWQPVGFGAFSGTVYDAGGAVLDTFTDPTVVFKGGKRTGQGTPLECVFYGTDGPLDDPYYGDDVTFAFSGTVYVKTKKA